MKTHGRNIVLSALAAFALAVDFSAIRAASFVPINGMAVQRYAATATLLPNGKVLVAGGIDSAGSFPGNPELYDPVAEGWTTGTEGIAANRYWHTSTLLLDGTALLAGSAAAGFGSSTAVYNPANGTSTVTDSLNTGRQQHTATLLGDGKVLVAGGLVGFSGTDSAELYDPVNNTWTDTQDLITARRLHTATLLRNGKVLVVGGLRTSSAVNNTELYDPVENTWAPTLFPLNVARSAHTATLLPDGKVLVVGGKGAGGSLSSAEVYDPVYETWTLTLSPNIARHLHSATLLPNGKVLVAGGLAGVTHLDSAQLYDPVDGTWSMTGSLNTARNTHTATLLPNGKVLIAGGNGTSGHLASAELYTPDSSTVSFVFLDIFIKYGSLTWKRASDSSTLDVIFYPKAAFQLQQFKRPTAEGGLGRLPIIGETIVLSDICCPEAPEYEDLERCMFTMCFDVRFANLVAIVTEFRVLSLSEEDDWVLCEATVPYHYAQEGVYEAGFYACRRPLTLHNRRDHGMEVHVKLDTLLPVSAGITREKIDMPPVSWVWPDWNGEGRVRVPTTVPPAPAMYSVALGEPNQAGRDRGNNCCYKSEGMPEGHANLEHIGNGEFRWPFPFDGICSFVLDFLGDWTVQVQVADANGAELRTMSDFMLKATITGRDKIQWLDAPPPVLNVEAGCMVHFNLSAQHAGYSGGQFTITSTALPYGAIVNPFHPSTVKNQTSVSSAFAWLPTASQVGSHIIHFIAGNTASDPADESRAYTSVIINVSSSGPIVTAIANKHAAEPSTAGRFAVYRSCASSSPLTVNYSVAGSASPASDYTSLPGSVTIPAGATFAYINVTPISDGLMEEIETVQLTLVPNGSAYQLSSSSVAIVNITNHFCSASSYDPVAWWKANGNGEDSVGTSHGQLNGGSTFTRGVVEDAFCFPDGSGYWRVQPSSSVDLGSGPGMTIECWIKPIGVGFENQPLVAWSKVGNTTVSLYLSEPFYGAGSLSALVLGTTGAGIIFSDPDIYPVVGGEWQHVALTYDRATGVARLYRNGVPIAEPQQWGDVSPDTSGATLDLGGFPDFSQFYRGQMDEVAVYKGALSANEIQAIFNAGGSGKRCP